LNILTWHAPNHATFIVHKFPFSFTNTTELLHNSVSNPHTNVLTAAEVSTNSTKKKCSTMIKKTFHVFRGLQCLVFMRSRASVGHNRDVWCIYPAVQKRPASSVWHYYILSFTRIRDADVVAPYSEDSRTVFQLPVASQARRSSVSISCAECNSGGERHTKVYSVSR
jgi:hypothetical protein